VQSVITACAPQADCGGEQYEQGECGACERGGAAAVLLGVGRQAPGSEELYAGQFQHAIGVGFHLIDCESPQDAVALDLAEELEFGHLFQERLVAVALCLGALCIVQGDAAVGREPRGVSERGAISHAPRQHGDGKDQDEES